MSPTLGIVAFVVGIIVSIMIHEWGHFTTARRFGMRADRFFFGFGPTLWSTRRGETEYGVKALPLGGFVRIVGMSPEDERRPDIADAWLDPEVLGEQRRQYAESVRSDVLTVAAVPPPAWQRLGVLLDERGTPGVVAEAIIEDVRSAEPATPDDARAALGKAIQRHVDPPTDDRTTTSGLYHRLTKGDQGRFFADKPAWQRAIVLAAGSFMHFTIAVVVLLGGLLLLPQITGEVTSTVASVVPGSTAAQIGLEAGDLVVAVNDVASDDFMVLRDEVRANPGQPIEVTVERNGDTLTLAGTPMTIEDPVTGEIVGQLGFAPEPQRRRLGLGEALEATFVGPTSVPAMAGASIGAVVDVFGPEGIGTLFDQIAGDDERSFEGGISMVGGAAVAGQGVAVAGLMFLISLLVSVNVFIGVFNLLPLPPLDGGHLAVVGVESATNGVRRLMGKPATFKVRPQTVAAIAVPVLIVIGTVGLGLIWLDITNPLQLP